jgi:hypothetical protein
MPRNLSPKVQDWYPLMYGIEPVPTIYIVSLTILALPNNERNSTKKPVPWWCLHHILPRGVQFNRPVRICII